MLLLFTQISYILLLAFAYGQVSFLSGSYGESGGGTFSDLNTGRINAMTEWGYARTSNHGYAILITRWVSDTTSGGPYGNLIDYTPIPCTPFHLTKDDHISGYQVYYSNFVFGLIFYTANGHQYSCYKDSSIVGKQNTGKISFLSDNYHLTGFAGRFGAILDQIQFQFTYIHPALINGLSIDSFSWSDSAESCNNYPIYSSSDGWCANNLNNSLTYLQVDLGDIYLISAVGTKSRACCNQWVTQYVLDYSIDGLTFFDDNINNPLIGNTNTSYDQLNAFNQQIIAQYLRFIPTAWNHWKSMRIEAYGNLYEYTSIPSTDNTSISPTNNTSTPPTHNTSISPTHNTLIPPIHRYNQRTTAQYINRTNA
eukprot:493258_1